MRRAHCSANSAYPCPPPVQALGNVLPIYILLIFSIMIRVLIARILEEKEKKIKEVGARLRWWTWWRW